MNTCIIISAYNKYQINYRFDFGCNLTSENCNHKLKQEQIKVTHLTTLPRAFKARK